MRFLTKLEGTLAQMGRPWPFWPTLFNVLGSARTSVRLSVRWSRLSWLNLTFLAKTSHYQSTHKILGVVGGSHLHKTGQSVGLEWALIVTINSASSGPSHKFD